MWSVTGFTKACFSVRSFCIMTWKSKWDTNISLFVQHYSLIKFGKNWIKQIVALQLLDDRSRDKTQFPNVAVKQFLLKCFTKFQNDMNLLYVFSGIKPWWRKVYTFVLHFWICKLVVYLWRSCWFWEKFR